MGCVRGTLRLISRNQERHVLSARHWFSLKTNMECFRKGMGAWDGGVDLLVSESQNEQPCSPAP